MWELLTAVFALSTALLAIWIYVLVKKLEERGQQDVITQPKDKS